jgi:dephospho-CoA kinase
LKNIAIAGRFAVGKTSVANILEANHGYVRMSIASSLKEFVNQMYARDVYGSDENARLQKSDIVFVNTPSGRKAVSVRQLLQDIGNGMKLIDQDIWLRGIRHQVLLWNEMGKPVVIDDVRFPREAEYLKNIGFLNIRLTASEVIRLERYFKTYGVTPNKQEINDKSETLVDAITPDHDLDGERSAEELADVIAALAVEQGNDFLY